MQLIQGNSISWPLSQVCVHFCFPDGVPHLLSVSTTAWLLIEASDWLAVNPPLCVWCIIFLLPANPILVRPFSLLGSNSSVFAQMVPVSLSFTYLLFLSLLSSVGWFFWLPTPSPLPHVLVLKLLLP